MSFRFPRNAVRRLKARLSPDPDRFLRRAKGVVHVGANMGQEREIYSRNGVRVLWIEPIPEIFAALKKNLTGFPDQRAVEALVSDVDGARCSFHIASNEGQSSSMLDLHLHTDVWPDVKFERTITLETVTLPTLLARHHLAADDYDCLVMDTQGSELLVLKGAKPLLPAFRFVKTEVADFEAYKGCCQLAELSAFLQANGFKESSRKAFASHKNGGTYYDVVFARSKP